ncbi:MAG: hypothetical protein RL204_634 [Bacteroidota bacterium]|jgi:hypothetical protein
MRVLYSETIDALDNFLFAVKGETSILFNLEQKFGSDQAQQILDVMHYPERMHTYIIFHLGQFVFYCSSDELGITHMWFIDSRSINNYSNLRSELYSMAWDNTKLCAFDDEFEAAYSKEIVVFLEQT